MIVGLMADTHDRLPFIEKAVKHLNKEKVEMVLHAGDYIAPFAVQRLNTLKARLIGVLGNNDAEQQLLKKGFADMGAELRGKFAEIMIDGLRTAILHGEETELLRSLISGNSYQILVHGHTHQAKTYREGETLVINPGEVCGYLTGKSTIATLDTRTQEVTIIELR
jgi:putative phosphoesterase